MPPEHTIRLTVAEAARLFGTSPKTIRQALRLNELTYIVVRGRYKINFASMLKWSQSSTRRKNMLAQGGMGQFVEQWKIKNKKFSPQVPTGGEN